MNSSISDMVKADEDTCETLLHENYAIVVDEALLDTCLNPVARCQIYTVGDPLISSYFAIGLQKGEKLLSY